MQTKRFMVPQFAVELAMDHKPSHRELCSRLLSDLCDYVFTQRDLARAYDILINNLSDMVLDTPEAPTALGNFIARSVADDCLPPAFVQNFKSPGDGVINTCINHASNLLTMKHGLVRLDNVWGVGGGTRPVKSLIRQMNTLLEEYLSSCDVDEATRCLRDLEVPHFHHELIYECIMLVLEKRSPKVEEVIVKLLTSLTGSITVTVDQLQNGFLRIYEDIDDIMLDVPNAYVSLDKFVSKCLHEQVINDFIKNQMPVRGRKRFVSEGDGGLVKS